MAWWWAKKKLHFVHYSQSYGGSKFNVPKNVAKVPNFGADLELGSCFGPERGQKRSKSQIFFPPRTVTSLAWWWAQKNLDFGHSSQSYKPLKFRQKVPKCGGFCQVSTQWGFFRHFSLLVPARATRGREIISRSFYEFWCTLCVTMLLSLGLCHQSPELEFMRTGGSSWPQVNPACPLTLSPHALHPAQLFGRPF